MNARRARDAEIRRLRSEGKGYAEIARMFGLTRQRVQQIAKVVRMPPPARPSNDPRYDGYWVDK